MQVGDEWTFEDTGVVRIPDDSPLGQMPEDTGTTTAAKPPAVPSWITAITSLAPAAAQIYATLRPPKSPKPAAAPQVVYQQAPAPLAPLSAGFPDWGIYAAVGGGVLVLGLVAYIVLRK